MSALLVSSEVKLIVLLVCLAVVLICLSGVAEAQDASPCTSGPDTASFLFLVDQSRSMGGGPGVVASDPTEQRRHAPAYVLARLGEESLFRLEHPKHAIGVIGFGSDASVDLPLTTIGPDPKDMAAWRAAREGLVAKIRAYDKGDTDFLPAFQEAARVLSDQQRQCLGKTGKPVVVLVTDGGPCPAREGCTADMPYWPRDLEYMERLAQQVRALSPPGGFKLYVLTVNRPGDVATSRVRPHWERLASEYEGEMIPVGADARDLPEVFCRIMGSLGLSCSEWKCGANYVDPYVSQLAIWFVKPSADTVIGVTLPDGGTLRLDDGRIVLRSDFGPDQGVVVRAPPPGQWMFSGCSSTRIYATAYQPAARLRAPTGVVALGDTVSPLQYTLVDANGDPLPMYEKDYPLNWEVSIAPPDQPTGPGCTLHTTQQPGIYECRPLQAAVLGIHQVAVRAWSKRADPYDSSRLLVAEDLGASYLVAAPVPTSTAIPTVPTSTPTLMPTASPPTPTSTVQPTRAPSTETATPPPPPQQRHHHLLRRATPRCACLGSY